MQLEKTPQTLSPLIEKYRREITLNTISSELIKMSIIELFGSSWEIGSFWNEGIFLKQLHSETVYINILAKLIRDMN